MLNIAVGVVDVTVFYQCPVCGKDVDDDNDLIKENPIKRCPLDLYYHEGCGYESHLNFCTNPKQCEELKNANDTCF